MTADGLAEVLARNRREGRRSLLVYLMIDAARRSALPSLVRTCREAGATGLELGFPFSDPIADGPILQAAAARSLAHGTRWRDLLRAVGIAARQLPVAVMTYANPVLQQGLARACHEIARAGGSGLIVPDLSLEESGPWRRASRQSGLSLVQMASPATSTTRIRALAKETAGFLYLVSRYGTTGRGKAIRGGNIGPAIRTAHATRAELPVLVGFGIRTGADIGPLRRAGADGAVVGSAVEEIVSAPRGTERLAQFLQALVAALQAPVPSQ